MPIRKLGQGQEVPFYDFAPDLNLTTPGIILDASGAIPTIKGYRARPSAVQISNSLPSAPLGAYVALYANGTTRIIAGTSNSLNYLVPGTGGGLGAWTNIGLGYTATWPWVFTQFGEDVLATSAGNTNIQVANGPTGSFTNLGGSPPTNAASVLSVAGFAAAYSGSEWFNSSAGTDTGWPPNVTTQSGSGFLYDYPGNIIASAALFRNQIVWKKDSTWMLTYIGGDQVWSSQVLSANTGTWGQGCVCPMPTAIAFLGTDDFYICQGAAPQRIPNSMKEWFFSICHKDANNNPDQLNLTSSWFDPLSATCYWHFVSQNPPYAGVPDRYVGWNSRSGRWVPGYLNTPLVVWNTQDGQQSGLYFDSNYALWQWSGPPSNMFILTGYQGDQDNLTQLQKVRVSYNQGYYPRSQTCTPMHVYRLGDYPTVDAPAVFNQLDGWFNLRATDRYHQVQVATVGQCEIMAMAYEGRLAGVR